MEGMDAGERSASLPARAAMARQLWAAQILGTLRLILKGEP